MFSHLHIHTEYSLLDGMCPITPLVARAKELGMDSLAITDHGVMHGVIQFYVAARAAAIKPIIGCEVYVARGSRLSRNNGVKDDYHHLVLLAKNLTGYRNLIQLTTKAHLEGFYYKPRVDKELLQQHCAGLVAMSACAGGEIPQLILGGRIEEAKQVALWYKQTFENFYLEIQRHPMPELEQINKVLIPMGAELDIPLVATNDTHYINREDAPAHDLLLCIGTNTTVQDEKRLKMAGDFFYLKTPAEMAELFKDIPEALANTEKIAAMCNLKLDFERLHLPEIALPPDKTPDAYLSDLCREGFPRYYPQATPEIEQRLGYELDVIRQTQFANYFLVVWDIVSFVRKNNILFGVRGSAAASIVLHCLGITEIDPIANKLVFERFLNIERREMPDIDLDFQDDRRDEVIAYVSQKYGQDHVAQIITFGTLGARAAIRDVGRALGMAYGDVDRVARLVPFAPNMTLTRALEETAELKSIYQEDKVVHNLVEAARKVEGISRHASTHAAGVVISKEALTRHVPLQQASKGENEAVVMTQFPMEDIARIGLLKMDFLGLANLTILGKSREIIRQNRGLDIDLYHLPMDDARTFNLLASGETVGVFQLEGSGMRRHIKELKPTTFNDIAAMVALYRPGPMEHIPTFIRGKHGLEPIHYPHPTLQRILEETYGVIVYQEQVLFIVQALAGYSLGQADIFRKAMGKKIVEVMKKEKVRFLEGAVKNGFTPELANEVFALIEPFAGYAFNKAHAVSYALVAYQTAYLKANYPAEYITAFLTIYTGVTDRVATAIAECQRLGIKVLPPDINRSQTAFAIEKDGDSPAIRFGLSAIKNVGLGAIEPVIAERNKNGLFKSVEEFCTRADLHSMNKRVLESLIKVGALDSLGSRGSLLANIDRILSLAQRELKRRETGQTTMFDLFGKETPLPLASLALETTDATPQEKSAWEEELLGVSLSETTLLGAGNGVNADITLCGQIDASLEEQKVAIIGRVVSVNSLLTRDKRPFLSALLKDISGSVEVMVWPKTFEKSRTLWRSGNMLEVKGRVRVREDRVQIGCDSVRPYQAETAISEPAPQGNGQPKQPKEEARPVKAVPSKLSHVVITINQTGDADGDIACLHQLVDTLRNFPGGDKVSLRVNDSDKIFNLDMNGLSVTYCPELQAKLTEMGKDGSIAIKMAGN